MVVRSLMGTNWLFFGSAKHKFPRRKTKAATKKEGDVRPGNVTQPCESHTQRANVGSPALKAGNRKTPGVKFKSGRTGKKIVENYPECQIR